MEIFHLTSQYNFSIKLINSKWVTSLFQLINPWWVTDKIEMSNFSFFKLINPKRVASLFSFYTVIDNGVFSLQIDSFSDSQANYLHFSIAIFLRNITLLLRIDFSNSNLHVNYLELFFFSFIISLFNSTLSPTRQ